jgi:hypothetical protein
VLALAIALAGATAAPAAKSALVPGSRIGTMTVARLGWSEHLPSVFQWCDSVVTRPGFYHRSCFVPQYRRLFVGFGDFRTSLPDLDRVWRREQWQLYLDGREIYLPAFGTDWRIVTGFPPGAYSSVLREWQVALIRPTRGRHTIRYISIRDDGVVDVTYTVHIA